MALSTRDDDRLIEVTGVLDFASAPYLRRLVFTLCDRRVGTIVVDLDGVRILDASTVETLLYLQRHATKHGTDLVVTGARGVVLSALEIAGVAKQLGVYDELVPWPHRDRVPVTREELDAAYGGWPPGLTGMLSDLRAIPRDDPRHDRLRTHIIEQALPTAQRLAKRFAGTGEPSADLTQVAALGLVKAVDGFDVEFGTEFGGYATPTIVGELKRHLRDRTWGVHVSRHLQELRILVNQGREELTRSLGRSPTVADLAVHLKVDEDEIINVLAAATAYRPISLEAPLSSAEDAGTLGDTVQDGDDAYVKIENAMTLRKLMRHLPRRDQEIIGMRFYGNLTQSEIAERMGISQMHVCRLLRRSLDTLRRGFVADQER